MATTHVKDPASGVPADSAYFVYDHVRGRTVYIGYREDCDNLAARRPDRYKVLPNN
jgi:hypothetical protein